MNFNYFFFIIVTYFIYLDYSYPVLGLIGFLITNAIHLTEAFYEKNESLVSFVSLFFYLLLTGT